MEIRGTNTDQWGGGLDEIVADNCSVHLERMSDRGLCLVLTDTSGRELIVHVGAKRAYCGAFVFADHE